eukprot:TRINITY_DN18558_c1_g1_i4.p1 TRINITY_DN18558_c1_g1~~TRINITY_DN18558_c1_g1_i4.p1  ORF type:complete len:660 (+),score=35.49 TRINITY_DN18558_c1_g1_i4:774-2753(+)
MVRPRRSYWNVARSEFNDHKFVVASIRRMNPTQFFNKTASSKVHVIGNLKHDSSIPLAVHSFLGKSDKLVPTKKLGSWENMFEATSQFFRSLHLSFAVRSFDSHEDPLRGMRRQFFKPFSSWTPPTECLPHTWDRYVWETSADLLSKLDKQKQKQQHLRFSSNLTWADHFAMRWLTDNESRVIDAPTDKNMGKALLERGLYDDLMKQAIQKSYSSISLTELNTIVDNTKRMIKSVCQFASDMKLLDQKVIDFLCCLCMDYRFPRARLLVKVHKKEIGARLISSGVRWLTVPIAVFLAVLLQPLVNALLYVARDSSHVIDRVKECYDAHADDQDQQRTGMYSFDVEQLYPSIPLQGALRCLRNQLVGFYQAKRVYDWGARVELACNMFEITMQSQVVLFRANDRDEAEAFVQTIGITTGLPCATQVANLFLSEMDEHVFQSFRSSIWLYQRFVDDILIYGRIVGLLEQILSAFNNWNDNIKVTHEDDERFDFVHFLDIQFDLSSGFVHKLYRKPGNTYSYTPGISCHSPHVFVSVIHTGLTRMLRVCSQRSDYERELAFFWTQLRRCGYAHKVFEKATASKNWHNRADVLQKKEKESDVKVVPFKIPYACGMEHLKIGAALNAHRMLLGDDADCFKLVACYVSNKNLFRLRFKRFLCRAF